MSLAVLTGIKKLQVVLGGAVSTSECPINVSYRDYSTASPMGSPGSADSITTGGTAVDAVPAPPAGFRRDLEGFSLYNDDTAAVTVTVRLYVNSSTTRVLWYGALQTDECLFYNESRGWYATDANANQKSNATGTSGASSEAKSENVSQSTLISGVTSGNVSQSVLISAGTSQNTSQSVLISALTSRVSSGE